MGWFHTSSYVNITKYRLIMINTFSTKIETPNTECIVVSGKVTPESNYIQILVIKSDLNEWQQAIYTNGVNLVSGKFITKIINTTAELNIDRMTSDSVEEGEDVFDFQTMSSEGQDALRDLSGLLIELIG